MLLALLLACSWEEAQPSPVIGPDGRVTTTLSEDAAVMCAKSNLEGLMTARLSYDAAFDNWGHDFKEIGWQPENRGDCAANVKFSMGPDALRLVPEGKQPSVPMGVAVVVRGPAKGRAFAVDSAVRVYELPRVDPAVTNGAEWTTGR